MAKDTVAKEAAEMCAEDDEEDVVDVTGVADAEEVLLDENAEVDAEAEDEERLRCC